MTGRCRSPFDSFFVATRLANPRVSFFDKKTGSLRALAAFGRGLIGLILVWVVTAGASRLGGTDDVTNTTIAYLFTVAFVSMYLGYRPALVAAAASALCIDYYFLPPLNTLVIAGGRDLFTMGSMFGVAIFISTLNERLKKQARAARQSERRTDALYSLVRELAGAHSSTELCVTAVRQIEGAAGVRASLFLRDGAGEFTRAFNAAGTISVSGEDLGAATRTANHLEPSGQGTRNLPTAAACYLPLVASRGCIGVMSLRTREPGGVAPKPSSLIVAMISQCAMSIERGFLIDEKQSAQLEIETERIRNAVLSAVSHDLRTPLAVIGSAASTLMEHGDRLDSRARTEMAKIVTDEAKRLSDLLKSLLDITRLQSGGLRVNRDWEVWKRSEAFCTGSRSRPERDKSSPPFRALCPWFGSMPS